MLNVDVTPLLLEILSNQPAMTMVGLVLAAKQTAPFDDLSWYGSFDLPSKLYITRQGDRVEGNPAGDEALEVRLSIERWTFKQ